MDVINDGISTERGIKLTKLKLVDQIIKISAAGNGKETGLYTVPMLSAPISSTEWPVYLILSRRKLQKPIQN